MSLRTFLCRVLQLLKGERRARPAAADAAPQPAARPIRFARLEDRRVFNASFVLNAAGLTVDNFTAPGALNVSEGPGELQFQLGSGMGSWIGNTAPGISLLNNGTLLTVQESLLQGSGQASNISIFAESPQGDVDVSVNDAINLSTSSTAAQFSIHADGNVLLTHATRGPNPVFDAPDHRISITAAGRIEIGGIVHGNSVDLDAGGDILVAGRVDSRSAIHVRSLAEVLDGQIEQVSFRGEFLDITATKGIGNADTLETDVGSLNAINTTEGTIDITETGNPGNLTIGRIENIGRSVRLQVDGGSLIDGNDLPGIQTNIQARDLFLQIGQDIGSAGPNPFPLFRNHIDVLLTGNLTANAPGFAAFSGRIDGQLIVQAHDLTLASLNDVDFTRGGQSSLLGLALIADLDGNGSGTVLIGDQLSMPEGLLIQGADVQASDGTIDLSAGRILFVSGQSEDVHINLVAGQNGQPGLFDARAGGNLGIISDSAVALADLDGNGFALQSLSANGALNLQAAGDVIVQGKLSAAGSITLASDGSMRVTGVIDPDTVTLTAADDITVSGAVSAATALKITAGTDDTGSLFTTSTAFVEAGVPGIPGTLLLRAGDQQGNVELNGTVRARGGITVKAGGGEINGSSELSAPALSLNASAGIGNLAPLRTRATTIDAATGTNGIFLSSSVAATCNSLSAGSGDIYVSSEQSLDIVSAIAGNGRLSFSTVDGDLKIQQAITEVGDIVLNSGGSGLVLIGNAIAGGQIRINSGTAIAELDDDPDADLRAQQIAFRAATGIGTAANPLEIDGLELTLAALTATGEIQLQALDHVIVGQTGDLQGLKISDPGDKNPGTSINLAAGGLMFISSSVENLANGRISLTAGQDIFQDAQTRIVTGGSGIISLVAGASQQTSLPGSIQMTDGAVISNQQGQISLLAAGDVVLAEVLSQSGDIAIQAGSGGAVGSIIENTVEEHLNIATTGLLSLIAASNVGGPDPLQDLNVHVFGLQATAGTGGIYVRSADFLRINNRGLLTEGGAGDIRVLTDAGGIEVAADIQAAGTGRIDLTAAADLKIRQSISSGSGSIRLSAGRVDTEAAGDIMTGGSGSIVVQAVNNEIVMDAESSFTAGAGDITLTSANRILLAELQTAGNVVIAATAGQVLDINDSSTLRRVNITANDLTLTAQAVGQRPMDFFTALPEALEVSVAGTLSVSVQEFAAFHGSVAATGTLEAETLFLMSAADLGFSTVNPSVKHLALLADVDGTNGGTLFLNAPVAVAGDLRISGSDLDGGTTGISLTAKNVLLQSGQSETVRLTLNSPGTGLPGTLDARSASALDIVADTPVQLRDLDGSGLALASTTGTGSLKLQAAGPIKVDGKIFTAADVVLNSGGEIVINAAIDPASIILTAADDITISNHLQATDLISVSAGTDGSGTLYISGESLLQAGSRSSGTGNIRLTAGQDSGNVDLRAAVQAGSRLTIVAASGSVDSSIQLSATTIDVDAGTGIGDLSTMQVQADSISADTVSGNIRIESTAPAAVTSLTTSAGAIFFSGSGDTDIKLATTGEGDIAVAVAAGELTARQVATTLGSVLLRTIQGGSVHVDSVAAAFSIFIDSSSAIREAGDDTEADLSSPEISLAARGEIGSSASALEISGPELHLAAQSDSGGIRLLALDSVTVTTQAELSGLSITNSDGTAAPAVIELTSTGAITIEAAVHNNSAGDVRLLADLDILQLSNTVVSTSGAGSITVQAGTSGGSGSQNFTGHSITMDDGTSVVNDTGLISLQATGDIRLSTVASTIGTLVVSAGGTLTPGGIIDNTLEENPNLSTAGIIRLSATAGIGGPSPDADIDLNADALEASSAFGSMYIRSAGPIRLTGQGLRTSGAAGNIELASETGSISVTAQVSAANAGNIALRAANQLNIRDRIASDTGFITLNGTHVTADASGHVATGGSGSIVINAFVNEINLDADSSLTAGSGLISLQADRHIYLSEIKTNGNVVAVSVNGDIFDANDSSTARRLNVTANNLTLTAASIGTAPSNFFTELPNGLEIDLTGNLTVQAQSFAALHGNINGTGTLAATTLFLISDQNIVFSTPGMPLVTNLALLADADGNGTGKLTLLNPVAVSGNLRIAANDIDGGAGGTRLTAQNLLLQSGQSEQVQIELRGPSTTQPGLLDARSAADLQITADSSVELKDLDGSGRALESSLTTGNIALNAAGSIKVTSKLYTGGNITLTSAADVVVNAAVDPQTVTISAANDLLISSQITADRLISLTAGTDGTGSLLTTAVSRLEAGGSTAIGDIALAAGSSEGDIQTHGVVRAADRLSATALAGTINGTAELTARAVSLKAGLGIGNTAPLGVRADNVAADTANGNIQLTSERGTVYTSITTGTGEIQIDSTGSADFTATRSQSGTIRLNVSNGRLNVGKAVAAEGSLQFRTTGSGEITIDSAIASDLILVDSAAAIQESGADTEADLQGTQIQLHAISGIGSATGEIELGGPDPLLAAQTETGDIALHATSSVTIGQVEQLQGLSITDPNDTNGSGLLSLQADGRIAVVNSVTNLSNGSIELAAGEGIQLLSSTVIFTGGSGLITLVAGDLPGLNQGTTAAPIDMADGTGVINEQGRIRVSSTGTQRISTIRSTSGRIEMSAGNSSFTSGILDITLSETPNVVTTGSISLSATGSIGGPTAADDFDIDAPALEASSTFESIHIRSIGPVRLEGLGLRTAGSAGNIELTTDEGGIDVAAGVSAASAGNIALRAANQLSIRDRIASDTGFITLNGTHVTADASGQVATGGSGSIVINAFITDISLDADSSLTAGNGLISLQADRHIYLSQLKTSGNVVAVSVNGDIFDANDSSTARRLNVTANNLTLNAASIGTAPSNFFTEMPNGLEIDLTGNLTVQAQSFAALHGNINGTGTLAATTLFLISDQNIVFSTPGMPLVTNLALLADADGNGTGKLTLLNPVAVSGNLRIAANDIDGGAGGTRLTAQNLLLQSGQSEQVQIELRGPSTTQPGLLDARSAADLQITADSSVELKDLDGSGRALESSLTTGNIALNAAGSIKVTSKLYTGGNITLTSAADVVVNAAVDPQTVTISAANDLVISSQITADRLISLTAGTDGTGSVLTTPASQIQAGNRLNSGDITITSGSQSGDIQLNGIVRATGKLTASALGGSINGGSELTAGTLNLTAATGIGNLNTLQIRAASVSADSLNGDVRLTSNTAAVYQSISTGTGKATLTSNAAAEIKKISTQEGSILIIAESAPILLDTANAGGFGNLTISNGNGDLQINDLQAVDNQIVIVAGSVSESVSDAAPDLTARQILLETSTGVGTGGKALDVTGNQLQLTAAAQTGSLLLAVAGNVTLSSRDGIDGLRLGIDGQPASTADGLLLSLTATGDILISAAVQNFAGGNIQLLADGRIQQQAAAAVSASRNGDLLIQARGSGSGISMNSGASMRSENGTIRLSASSDIELSLLQTAGSVTVQSLTGQIVDNNDDSGISRTNIIADNLLLQAVTIGGSTTDFFNGLPQPLELELTGRLSAEARDFAALRGSSFDTDSLQAETLFLISDNHLSIGGTDPQRLGSLALIADADNDGVGTITLQQPVQVANRLRLQAHDITAGQQIISLSAKQILVRSVASQQLSITPPPDSTGNTTEFDGQGGDKLSVSSAGSLDLTDLDGDAHALKARLEAFATARENLIVTADVSAASVIEFSSDHNLQVSSTARSSDVRLTAADGSAVISGSLEATNAVTVRAGLGTAGSIAVTTGGRILAGDSPSTGTILLTSGSITGNQLLEGQLQAGERITLTALGGQISGAGSIQSSEVLLTAGNGIGAELPLQLTAAHVSAESTAGQVLLSNSRDSRFTRVATSEGMIMVTGTGQTNFEDVLAVDGNISLSTLGGDLTVVLARQQNSGDLDLSTAESGSIVIGRVSTPGILYATAADSILELGQDPDSDIDAASIALQARSGIGTAANSLELGTAPVSLAAVTETGHINLLSFGETLITQVAELTGLLITDASLQTPGSIRFSSSRMINIESSVINSSGGDLELISGDHLRLLPGAAVRAAGQGNITLAAGAGQTGNTAASFGSLTLSPETLVASEHGSVTLTAAASVSLFRVQSIDGDITVKAALENSDGRLIGDLQQNTAHISTEGFVSLFAGTTDQFWTADLKVAAGSLEATLLGGTLRLDAISSLTIAGTGLRTDGASSDISVQVHDSDLTVAAAVRAGGGSIRLNAAGNVLVQSAAVVRTSGVGTISIDAQGGDLAMQGDASIVSESGGISITAKNNLQITRIASEIGELALTASAGSISDVSENEMLNLATAGAVWLQAGLGIGGSQPAGDLNISAGQLDSVSGQNGIFLTSPGSMAVTRNGLISGGSNGAVRVRAAGEFRVLQQVLATTGDISVTAADVVVAGTAQIQTLAGNITIIADGGGLTMSEAAFIDAAGDASVSTSTDASVSSISAQNHLRLSSRSGAIIDVNDSNGAVRLNLTAGSLDLEAATGIGSDNPLEISTTRVVAANHGSGDLRLTQVAAAGNLGLDLLSNTDGLISLTVAGGALNDVNDDGSVAGLNLQAATAVLQARDGIGSGNPLETRLDSLTASSSAAGNLEFQEFDSLRLESLKLTGTGSIIVKAGQSLLVDGPVQVLRRAGDSTGFPDASQSEIRLTAIDNLQLTANALVSSSMNHSISMLAGGNLTMQTGSAAATNGGDLLIQTDSRTGGDILVQNLATTGNRLTIVSGGDIRIGDTLPVQLRATNGNPARSEQILIDAGRNIRVADGVVISTDGNPATNASAQQTDDRLLLIAHGRTTAGQQAEDSATGKVLFDGRVTLRTDGGVATTFLARPAAGAASSTAFFDASRAETSPQGRLVFPGMLGPDPNAPSQSGPGSASLQVAFEVQITSGATSDQPAEENLRLDIDWRDPSDPQPSTLYVNPGRQLLGHSYSMNEFLRFLEAGKSQFLVDFSVSHHESIRVFGGSVQQGQFSAVVPVGKVHNPATGNDLTTGLISSSDSAATGNLQPGDTGGPRDVFSDADSDADFHFDGAVVRIQVPVSPFGSGPFNNNGNGPGNGNRGNGDSDGQAFQRAPRRTFIPPVLQQPPAKAQVKPRADFEPVVAPILLNNSVVQQESEMADNLAATEDTYEVRQSELGRYTVLRQLNKLEQGEELLNPQALQAWVLRQSGQTERPLLDGEDYELWLVTKKRTASGAVVRIERQLLMFDVIDGQPFPARDDQAPDHSEKLPQLQPVPPEPVPPQPAPNS